MEPNIASWKPKSYKALALEHFRKLNILLEDWAQYLED